MKVAVIILNFQNYEMTIKTLKNIRKSQKVNLGIFIIDNNSSDNSVEEIKKVLLEGEILYVSKHNGGYASGNNIGLKMAIATGYNYFCILNNDVITYPETLFTLCNFLKENTEVGVVGPGICTAENNQVLESAGSVVSLYTGKIKRLYTGEKREAIANLEISCDYVGGACMVFRKNVLDEIGFLPEDYFLFFEENEWCLRIRRAGYTVVCDGKASVVHLGSATINNFSGLSEYFTYRNMVLFVRRNGTLTNKLIFYPYIILFVLKSGLTKKNGWRYCRYFMDAMRGRITYKM